MKMENDLFSLDTILLCKNLLTYPNINCLLQIENLSKEFKESLKVFESIDCTISAIHNFFQNLKKETFLSEILFSVLSLKDNFLLGDFLENIIKSAQDSKYSKEEILISFILLLYFYLQETIYGPSPFFIFETEKVDFKDNLDVFYNHNFFKIQTILDLPPVKSQLINYLTISGESPYDHSKLLLFFIIPYHFFITSNSFRL